MKSLAVFIVMFAMMFAGCKEKDTPSKMTSIDKNSMKKESKNAKDDFRRFTYFFESDNPKTAELLQGVDWEKVTESAKNYGIYQANCYKKDNDYFFILDAEPIMDGKTVMTTFINVAEIQSLIEKLKEMGVSFLKEDGALERIYNMDQKVIYGPMEGQLKTNTVPHKRFVWTLLLKENPELMAEYKKAHSMGNAWPQITENMKSVGVKDMEIYLHGTQAILIMDTKPDFDMDLTGPIWQKLPKEKDWQEYVAKFQRTQPGSSIQEKWQDMEKL